MRVIVTDYNPKWPGLFEVEANQLREVFGEELIALHHIGSTSVTGLRAKPIIDIMPVVRDIEVVDRFNDKMIGLGYKPMGKFGIPERRFFESNAWLRTCIAELFHPCHRYGI